MDREFEQPKEPFRSTILMQDNSFRQQVKELHRLYNVQRRLMDDLKPESSKTIANYVSHDHKPFADGVNAKNDEATSSRDSKSASCSSNTAVACTSVPNCFNLERHTLQDDNCSRSVGFGKLSIIGNGSSHEGEELDLTLSIGFGKKKLSL